MLPEFAIRSRVTALAGVTLAAAVAVAGLVAQPPTARAAVSFFGEHAALAPFGDHVVLPFGGCQDSKKYPQITLVYYPQGGAPESQQLTPGSSYASVTVGLGTTGYSVTCTGASSTIPDRSGYTEIIGVWDTLEASGPLQPGQPVTLSASGLQPGESASLALVDRTGQQAPRQLGTSAADDSGYWTQTLIVPSDLPEDYYHLTLTTASNVVFYGKEQRWGQQPAVRRLPPTITGPSQVKAGRKFILNYSGCLANEAVQLESSSVQGSYPVQKLHPGYSSVAVMAKSVPVTYVVVCTDSDGLPWRSEGFTVTPA